MCSKRLAFGLASFERYHVAHETIQSYREAGNGGTSSGTVRLAPVWC